MRIERITTENIGGTEGELTVDFTAAPLEGSPLFVAGNGKGEWGRNLPDVLCMTLYGIRARKGTGKEGTDGELPKLSEGKRKGRVSVRFRGRDGGVYEVTLRLERGKDEGTAKAERTLRRVSPSPQMMAETWEESAEGIRETTGMDGADFRRSLIVEADAMGTLMDEGEGTERAQRLERLTGTEMFARVGRKIAEKNRAAQETVRRTEAQMEALRTQLPGEEEKTALEASIAQQRNRLQTTADEIERTRRQIDWYRRRRRARERERAAADKLRKAEDAWNALQNDKRELDRRDLLLPIEPLYHKRLGVATALENAHAQLAAAEQRLEESRTAKTNAETEAKKAREAYETAHRMMRQREEDIEEGVRAIWRMERLEGEVKRREKRLAESRSELDKAKEQKARSEEDVARTEKTLKELGERMDSMNVHRLMVEDIERIVAELRNVTRRRAEAKQIEEETEKAELARSKAKAELTELELELDELKKRQSELTGNRERLKRRNEAHDLEKIQKRIERLDTTKRAAEAAGRMWGVIAEGWRIMDLANSNLHNNRQRLDALKGRLEETTKRAERLSKERDNLYKQLMLVQAADIRELRKNLREGTPCPVCGSHHHPYHTEMEQKLGRLALQVQTDYEETAKDAAAAVAALNDLRERIADLEGAVRQGEEEMKRLNETEGVYEKEWKAYEALDSRLGGKMEDVNADARRITIESIVNNATKEIEEQELLRDQILERRSEIDRLNGLIEANAAEIEKKSELRSKAMGNYTYRDRQLGSLQERRERINSELSVTYSQLAEKINLPTWHKEHAADGEAFVKKINNIARRYRETQTEMTRQEAARAEAQRNATTLERWIESRNNRMENEEREATALRNAIGEANRKLKQLFGEKDPRDVQREMRKERDSRETEAGEKQKAADATVGKVKIAEGEVATIKHNIEGLRAEQKKTQDALDTLINRTNASGTSPVQYHELEKYFSQERDWNALRTKIDAAHEAMHDCKVEVDRLTHELSAIQNETGRPENGKEETEEALEFRLHEDERLWERLNVEVNRGVARMEQDACLRNRIKELEGMRKEAERQWEEWRKLSDVFGSEDGERFRLIGQAEVLDRIVDGANRVLRSVANRYRLRHADGEMGLNVIDRDRGDEPNDPNALTGAERFKVCVAMGIALAEMGGEEGMVDPLFVDGNFGGMNGEDVEAAVDFLCRLRLSGGRKIGLMGNAEALRRRLSPQLRLRTDKDGKMAVEFA